MKATCWKKVPLSEVLMERQETPDSGALESGTIRIVSKICFNTGKIEFRSIGNTNTKMITIHPGDLVLSGINATKGGIAIYPKSEDQLAAATIHYQAYKVNQHIANRTFLWWLFRSRSFREILSLHLPSGIKTGLKSSRLLSIPVPLPSVTEQDRIMTKLDVLAAKIEEAWENERGMEQEAKMMLHSAFARIIEGAPRRRIGAVAPLVRRPIEITVDSKYPELAVRSFGKGTFQKPTLIGANLTWQKLFRVHEGDIVINNIKAWEGAIAVAVPDDDCCMGSHHYLTLVPAKGKATAGFLCFYLLTDEGLSDIDRASPGSADRNRTLDQKALEEIEVPVPDYDKQVWFDRLQAKVHEMITAQQEIETELATMFPSILEKAFKGEL